MKKGDVVVWGLIPTAQDAPETVQLTMGTFHHPTPRLETGLPFDSLSLFASTADVGSESEPLQGMAHLGKVVALVKAHPQGMGWAGCRPLHWQAVHRGAPTGFMSWRLAPSTASPTGTPAASVSRLRLTPRFPRSVGLAPVFPPTQGRFGHGAVHAHPTPVQPLQFVVAFQSHPPQLQEHPSGHPFLEAQVGGGTGTDARGVQRFPLVRQRRMRNT